ncbi:MAG: stage II sporulation protein M [Planctomycetes bacterium]|nr:stage II sporulation protein M [Planctomycetota bacterium]
MRSLSVEEVKQLCRLYRQVTIDLSQARASGDDPSVLLYLNSLVARTHGQVYAAKQITLWPLLTFVVTGFPKLLRRNWKYVGAATAVFFLTSLASALAVIRSPELAYSLFDEQTVEYENLRLEKQEGEYRGNFTFKVSESPLVAAQIIGNNVKVAIFGFALGAAGCVLGILLLISNGRMLGTLSGLVWNGGYFVGFYSMIMTHGVLELSAICIASAGGLRLGWAIFAPGRMTRSDAYRAAAGDAFGLLAGSVLMLVVAGIIEAFVTPHFGVTVRWSVAIGTGVIFALYAGLLGHERSVPLAA